MAIRQALLRPIEITTANNRLTVVSAGTPINIDIPVGVYGNIFELMKILSGTIDSPVVYLSAEFRVVIALLVTISSTELSALLGFRGDETISDGITATYAPSHCYVPSYYSSNTDRWCSDSADAFHGAVGSDGNLCGITMSQREKKRFRWPVEIAKNAYPSAASASFEFASGDIRLPETNSCFWSVVNGARTASISNAGSISPKGLYYVHDVSSLLGSAAPSASITWDSGGTNFDVTTAEHQDLFVFCSVAGSPAPPVSHDPKLLSYYDVEVELTTAVAPTWTTSSVAPS